MLEERPARIAIELHSRVLGGSAKGASLCCGTVCAVGSVLLGVQAHPEVSPGFKDQACDEFGERKPYAHDGVRASREVKAAEAAFGVTSLPYDLPRSTVGMRLTSEWAQCPL